MKKIDMFTYFTKRRGQMYICLFLSFIFISCGGAQQEEDVQVFPYIDYTEEGLRVLYSDTNLDGIADVAKYFTIELDEEGEVLEERLVLTELDLSGDGQYNMRRHYDESEQLFQEEMDGNLDGIMDHHVIWEGGQIMESQRDDNFDGVFDSFRFYRDGFLVRVERDLNGNGTVDMWSFYDRFGMNRVGYDTTGNGVANQWTRRPDQE
jgi:hypothetical protein